MKELVSNLQKHRITLIALKVTKDKVLKYNIEKPGSFFNVLNYNSIQLSAPYANPRYNKNFKELLKDVRENTDKVKIISRVKKVCVLVPFSVEKIKENLYDYNADYKEFLIASDEFGYVTDILKKENIEEMLLENGVLKSVKSPITPSKLTRAMFKAYYDIFFFLPILLWYLFILKIQLNCQKKQ